MENKTKQLIKTEILLDDSGKEFNTGRHRYSNMYMRVLSKEEALERFDEGERVYFIYQAPYTLRIYEKVCRKVCKDRDYLKDHYDIYNEVCGVSMPLNVLLDEEYNVLNLLATRSKMDCWFWLIERKGKDMVRNLEENKIMSLKSALPGFIDGLTDLDDYFISEEEKAVFLQLIERFGIADAFNARLK